MKIYAVPQDKLFVSIKKNQTLFSSQVTVPDLISYFDRSDCLFVFLKEEDAKAYIRNSSVDAYSADKKVTKGFYSFHLFELTLENEVNVDDLVKGNNDSYKLSINQVSHAWCIPKSCLSFLPTMTLIALDGGHAITFSLSDKHTMPSKKKSCVVL
jgi:hypothetical protein